MDDILEGYAAAATPGLIARYETFDPDTLYAPVLDLLPTNPVSAADIGAGTGRDAAWLARRGHAVLAVEPVKAFRDAGTALHAGSGIEWIDDRLPDLAKTAAYGPFNLVTLCGVWQHIDDPARTIAITNLGRMISAGGLLIVSLRHGPGAPGRRVFPVSPEETVAAARKAGLVPVRLSRTESVQPGNRAMGVHWTWLALMKAPLE